MIEYKTVSLSDPETGKVAPSQITEMLNRNAKEGWELVTVYTNEIGTTSEPKGVLFSFRVNSTICQHIFIFKRQV